MFNPPKMICVNNCYLTNYSYFILSEGCLSCIIPLLVEGSTASKRNGYVRSSQCTVFLTPPGVYFQPLTRGGGGGQYLELWFNFCMLELFVIMIISVWGKIEKNAVYMDKISSDWVWLLSAAISDVLHISASSRVRDAVSGANLFKAT